MAVAQVAAGRVQRLAPPLSVAVALTIVVVAVLAIPLATAQALEFRLNRRAPGCSPSTPFRACSVWS